MVARQAHNLEVACSSPASATQKPVHPTGFFRFASARFFTCSRSQFFAKRSVPTGRARVLPPQLSEASPSDWLFSFCFGKTLHMLPVAVLRRAKRPFGPSASPASATLRSQSVRLAFFVSGRILHMLPVAVLPEINSFFVGILLKTTMPSKVVV